jgi:hypothetical protein
MLFSQLLATLRKPRQAPDPLPRHCLPTLPAVELWKRAYSRTRLRLTRAWSRITYCTSRFKALSVVMTSAEPQLDARNTSTRGVRRVRTCMHDLLIQTQTVAIFLEQPSSLRIYIATLTLAPSTQLVLTLTRRAPVYPATVSQRTRADGAVLAIRHLVRFARVQLSHTHSTVI